MAKAWYDGSMKKDDVQISAEVLKLARKMAQKRNCTPDEMISIALEQYRDELAAWRRIQKEYQRAAKKAGISTMDDVVDMVHEYRAEQRKKTASGS